MLRILWGGVGPERGVRDQLDAELVDRGRHRGVGERPHLGLALGEVDRLVAWRAVAGMARHLGPALVALVAEHPLEERDRHVLEVRDLPFPLRVEAADEL